MNRSLRVSLSLLLIALSLIPTLAVGLALGIGIFQQEREHALAMQRQLADHAANQINVYLTGAENELYALQQSASARLRTEDREILNSVLADELTYRDTFHELAVVRADGSEIARVTRLGPVPKEELRDYRNQMIVDETIRLNRTYIGGFSPDQSAGEPLLEMAVPTLQGRTDRLNGVLIGKVRMGQTFDQITSLPVGERGAMFIADERGTLIAHPNLLNLPASAQQITLGDEGLTRTVTGEPALRVLLPTAFQNLNLVIGAEMPLIEADANLRDALADASILLIAVLIVTAMLVVFIVGRLVAPILNLAHAAEQISGGDLSQQVTVTRQDELGTLQRNFNQMVSDLRAQQLALTERSEELQASLDRQQALTDTVAELATPLLPVWDGVIVFPVVGYVDQERGAALTATLVQGVASRQAKVAIIDITGLTAINSQVLNGVTRAAQAAELLGARAMLAGVSANAAQYIVASQLNLGQIASYRDLQSATEAAIKWIEQQRS